MASLPMVRPRSRGARSRRYPGLRRPGLRRFLVTGGAAPAVLVLGAALTLFGPPARAQGGVQATGTATASVTLAFTADLGPSLVLRLSAATLSFDLRSVGGDDAPTCVIGASDDAVVVGPFVGTRIVAPGGTSLRIDTWPSASVVGGTALSEFPAPPDAGSVVCYRTFLLGAFANVDGWQLLASALPVAGAQPIRAVYLGATCRDAQATGLAPISDGARATLMQGTDTVVCGEMLVAVAVKLQSEPAGTSATAIRYTLLAPDADFGTE